MNFRALEKSIRVLEKSWKSPENLFLKKGTSPGDVIIEVSLKTVWRMWRKLGWKTGVLQSTVNKP